MKVLAKFINVRRKLYKQIKKTESEYRKYKNNKPIWCWESNYDTYYKNLLSKLSQLNQKYDKINRYIIIKERERKS